MAPANMNTAQSMKTSSPDKVRDFYESSAESYSQMMEAEIDLPLYADTLGSLADRLSEVAGTVIDTSCGSGHMLWMYAERFDPNRALLGLDLSPEMVAIASTRLGSKGKIVVGDMRTLDDVAPESAAAVLSFFAVHHLDPENVVGALKQWHRVLRGRGQLVLGTWEGNGPIDYGSHTNVVALRYSQEEVSSWVSEAGFAIDRSVVEPVEGMPMDAVYIEATKE